MKFYRFSVYVLLTVVSALFAVSCSDDGQVDNRELDYGYVQFKLYKEASYEPASKGDSRATQQPLDYLSDAEKIRVVLAYGETTLSQTMPMQTIDPSIGEYGLRSEKLKLQTGDYRVVTYMLYDAEDEPIYTASVEGEQQLTVVAGGLTVHDLTVDVAARGSVRFNLAKDFSEFSRAAERMYTFDEIASVTLSVRNKATNRTTTFEKLPATFSIHFDEGDQTGFGYQTSSIVCDTLLSIPAGGYELLSYQVFDSSKVLLEINTKPKATSFEVSDNEQTEVTVPVSLYEADAYIQDYYALYEIWKALDGENWYYVGEDYAAGTNWDFNKDIDLWGIQPGVQVHPNGRVARLDISNFAFRGHMPEALGQLTELVELYLGTHNDTNLMTYDPMLDGRKSLSERQANRMEYHKMFLAQMHPGTQVTEPIARALKEHNISIPGTRLYETMNEQEIFDLKSGTQRSFGLRDTHFGTINNGLKSLPSTIGNLKKLAMLNIAHSEIEELPEEIALLESCTDLEIYNCPKMTKFPMVIAKMPELVSLNLSNNAQWSAEEIYNGLEALATGPAKEKIQILYARENNLEAFPASLGNMQKIGLLDLAYNKISKVHALGKSFSPVQLYLDHNQIEHLPVDSEFYFCGYADSEAFSVAFNKLTKFPNIFSAKSNSILKSVDFSGNDIRSFEGEEDGTYRGIKVDQLSLAQNYNLKRYPTAFAKTNSLVSYIILRACGLEEVPSEAFTYAGYTNIVDLVSLDLSYNHLTDLPRDFHAGNMPYLYGVELSFNSFSKFPYEPLDASGLTVFAIRSQRDENGRRCLREWPTGIYQHVGLRGFYIGSNDLREINDTISTICYYLDISDNPNIIFDASDICYAWQVGAYILIYDKTQNILNCDMMLD